MSIKLLDRRFLLLRSLGCGAAGEVFEASLTQDTAYGSKGQRVAVKIFNQWVLNHPGQALRIDRELRAGNSIKSTNAVRTYELGSDGACTFLVMELLKGRTLTLWLAGRRGLDFETLVEVAHGLIAGLCAIHENKLVHRDLKPDNVIMTDRGPVITDLGVLMDLRAETVVTGKEFLGTIAYSAPEVLFGEGCNASADIYSFGAILYELLFGQPQIDPSTYWSKQIVRKHEAQYVVSEKQWPLLAEKLDAYGFVKTKFLVELLCAPLRRDRSERPSAEQVNAAFRDRVWEQTFQVPFRKSEWPHAPREVRQRALEMVPLFRSEDVDVLRSATYFGMEVCRSSCCSETRL